MPAAGPEFPALFDVMGHRVEPDWMLLAPLDKGSALPTPPIDAAARRARVAADTWKIERDTYGGQPGRWAPRRSVARVNNRIATGYATWRDEVDEIQHSLDRPWRVDEWPVIVSRAEELLGNVGFSSSARRWLIWRGAANRPWWVWADPVQVDTERLPSDVGLIDGTPPSLDTPDPRLADLLGSYGGIHGPLWWAWGVLAEEERRRRSEQEHIRSVAEQCAIAWSLAPDHERELVAQLTRFLDVGRSQGWAAGSHVRGMQVADAVRLADRRNGEGGGATLTAAQEDFRRFIAELKTAFGGSLTPYGMADEIVAILTNKHDARRARALEACFSADRRERFLNGKIDTVDLRDTLEQRIRRTRVLPS